MASELSLRRSESLLLPIDPSHDLQEAKLESQTQGSDVASLAIDDQRVIKHISPEDVGGCSQATSRLEDHLELCA